MNKSNVKKMLKTVDVYGAYVFGNLDEDDYDDFWDEYKDFLKSDDYDDYKDKWEDNEEKTIETLEDTFDEYKSEDSSIKVKEFKSVKKVSKNLYKVRVRLEIKEDDEKSKENATIYVMKKGTKCYIIGGDDMMF